MNWLLLQNLPSTMTEEDLRSHLTNPEWRIERLIFLNKQSTNVCALLKEGTNKMCMMRLCVFLRASTLPGMSAFKV